MELSSFFEQTEGKWISQRTTYYLKHKKIINNKSEFIIQKLNKSVKLENIYQQLKAGSRDYSAYSITWDIGPEKHKTIYNLFPTDKASGNLRKIDQDIQTNHDFYLDKPNSLHLYCSNNDLKSHEHIYFINSNLRISTSIVKKINKCIAISFASEIRINNNA